ncbi:hypothetical protein NB696_001229 [Xanthomonas sacchari]|nr:hypothetical protein [Xanthomonas sacchari]MCW0444357.1 hypothetical protein [Xanthomonas sacchari]
MPGRCDPCKLDLVIACYYISAMKQRPVPAEDRDSAASFKVLARTLAQLGKPQEVAAFLQDLCTPAELEAMADRWRVVPLLLKGVPYREIHDLTQVSVTTIGRVARTLEYGAGGYAAALRRQTARPSDSH